MWVLAAALVAFAISLKQQIFFAGTGEASFVVYAICYAIIKRRQDDAQVKDS